MNRLRSHCLHCAEQFLSFQSINKALKILILAAGLSLATPDRTVITDIPNWKHPTKAVFQSKGIAIHSVVLVNKTKPIFHVTFPVTPSTCDTNALSQTLREVSKANGYWSYAIIDSTSKSTFLKAEVSGDPKKRQTTGIDYQVRQPCFSESVAMKSFACSAGLLEVFDRSVEPDAFNYELRFQKSSARFSSGAFSLDGIQEAKGQSAAKASTFLVATFSGPGMNCHEQYRVFQIATTGKIEVSEPFGMCSEIAEIKRSGESVLIKTTSEMEGVPPASFLWKDGKLIESKTP
ncbi:MAG: hypothetical protein RL173_462 [Fibrobacterota bacterium]